MWVLLCFEDCVAIIPLLIFTRWIPQETLAKMTKKLETVSQRWKEGDAFQLSDGNQRRLADFHLTRLSLGKTEPLM